MVSLKTIELLYRRVLLRFLRMLFSKKRTLPAHIDYNSCTFLFLRQDLIGDALISTPLLHALKGRYPGAQLDVLMSPKNHFVLSNDPVIRNRLVYTKSVVETFVLLQKVRGSAYDFIVDLIDNKSTTSTLWCLLGGARFRVGLAKENDFCYDVVVPLLPKKKFHVADRTANLLTAFGIDPTNEELRIFYKPAQEAETFADQFWAHLRTEAKPVIGINISAGASYRMWWGENCRDFMRTIMKKFPGWKILILSLPSDRSKAEEVAHAVPGSILAPVTPTFDHAAALVKRMDFLVTPATSICQVAGAFNVPSVVLYPNLAVLHGHLWEPYRSDTESLAAHVDDIDTIPSQDVVNALERLVSLHPHAGKKTMLARQA
ncbi:MAG: glycosyltransferase family 9 protein [Ignavibacteriales bacterium]|nr:glycosyltransferase family 9 protein [Ignavibacteriales bacterium]